MTEISRRAFALYKPPFRYDGHGYVWDANGEMVLDQVAEGGGPDGPPPPTTMVSTLGATLRIRGWGRIGYLEHPVQLQDAVGELVARALTELWERERTKP